MRFGPRSSSRERWLPRLADGGDILLWPHRPPKQAPTPLNDRNGIHCKGNFEGQEVVRPRTQLAQALQHAWARRELLGMAFKAYDPTSRGQPRRALCISVA